MSVVSNMECGSVKGTDIQPIVEPLVPLHDLPRNPLRPVFITSIRMPEQQIWTNGLFQNIFMLYKLFEAAGYLPFLLVDDNKKNPDSKLYERYRTLDAQGWAEKPFHIYAYIEMGMSCGPQIRQLFKKAGARMFKLYLGNILNIDIETPMFHPQTNFCHHMVGDIDTILVSPHYDFHQEYAAAVNKVYPSVKIAPYVWEPYYVSDMVDTYKHRAAGPYSFTIMEPNISFQKSSFIPIMIVESYFRRNPDLVHEVAVVNGNKLMESAYFKHTILPTLDIYKAGKLHMLPRADIKNLNKTLNSHIIIQHNVNNEYNYAFFEHLLMGFPVIHNCVKFKSWGYYYNENDIAAGHEQIDVVTSTHLARAEAYKSANQQLFWNFSIHNPANLKGWIALLDGTAA